MPAQETQKKQERMGKLLSSALNNPNVHEASVAFAAAHRLATNGRLDSYVVPASKHKELEAKLSELTTVVNQFTPVINELETQIKAKDEELALQSQKIRTLQVEAALASNPQLPPTFNDAELRSVVLPVAVESVALSAVFVIGSGFLAWSQLAVLPLQCVWASTVLKMPLKTGKDILRALQKTSRIAPLVSLMSLGIAAWNEYTSRNETLNLCAEALTKHDYFGQLLQQGLTTSYQQNERSKRLCEATATNIVDLELSGQTMPKTMQKATIVVSTPWVNTLLGTHTTIRSSYDVQTRLIPRRGTAEYQREYLSLSLR